MPMVRFAPLNVPLRRRLQTASVCMVVFAPYILVGGFLAVCMLAGPLWFVPVLAYLAYLAYDWNAPRSGGHRPWFRTLSRPFFRVVSSYFPSQMVRSTPAGCDAGKQGAQTHSHETESSVEQWKETTEEKEREKEKRVKQFDPSERYFFAVVPHGFIGIGVWCSFISDGNGFSRLFPGVRLRCLTLAMNFVLPVWRDYLLGLGMVDCSRASIRNAFARGLSLMVVPGGAREALYARPSDKVTLLIQRRKGFVKCALEGGAHLV
jgi:2-acylglycerol O-acyltransferase 2